MNELGLSTPELASRAGVDPTTVRAFLRGSSWPRETTRAKLARALGWRVGDAARIAVAGHMQLQSVSTRELLKELCRRVDEWPDIE